MAGDWIKMRADLFTHPKVVRISSALKADTLRTVGGLMSAWCLFDAHSVDGSLDGYTSETLDAHLRWDGFAAAMIAVEWLDDDGSSLSLPRFDAHNGASSKRRAQDADRKRTVRNVSASEPDEKRTRKELKRTEKKEEQEQATPPKPKKTKAAELTLSDWILALGDADAIAPDDAVFDWAAKAHIPREWVALAWWAFEGRYLDNPKTYVDWRAVFRKALREDWLKLWRRDQRTDTWALTTAGDMALREMSA